MSLDMEAERKKARDYLAGDKTIQLQRKGANIGITTEKEVIASQIKKPAAAEQQLSPAQRLAAYLKKIS